MKKIFEQTLTPAKWALLAVVFIGTSISCKKFIEINPPKTEIVNEAVFTTDESAKSAIRGIYSMMMTNQSFVNGRLELFCGLSCDELRNYASRADQVQFANNSLLPTNANVSSVFWGEAYKYISNANSILEGLGNSTSLSPDLKRELEGEARFVRAFCHFYLVNLFGDVPYVTTTDYKVNAIIRQLPKQDVYLKIKEDLISARGLLASDFSFSQNKRIQPNKGAATALLARVCLYTGDWAGAEILASELINNTATYSLRTDLNTVFKPNSVETIWELQPVRPSTNTSQATIFIVTGTPSNNNVGAVSLTSATYNAFEIGDTRKTNWTSSFTNTSGTYYFPYKYKVLISSTPTEYNIVFRLAEQFLIRAEARTRLNNIPDAQSDLNKIRNRAALSNTSANDQASLLAAIEQERRIEFLGEFGHRWLDLKRTNRADAVLSPLKIGWQPTDILYPIPLSEILLNPNLIQNLGY